MDRIIYVLRELVWSSIIAVLLSAAAVVAAVVNPESLALPISLGLAAVTSALLAQRS